MTKREIIEDVVLAGVISALFVIDQITVLKHSLSISAETYRRVWAARRRGQ